MNFHPITLYENLRYVSLLMTVFRTYFILFGSRLCIKMSYKTCLTCRFVAWPRGGLSFILKQCCTDKPKWMNEPMYPLASHPPLSFHWGRQQAAQIDKLGAIYFVIFLLFNITVLNLVLLWGFLNDGQICLISESLCNLTNLRSFIWMSSRNHQLFSFVKRIQKTG